MPNFDENGNGSYTRTETEAAIEALSGDNNVLYALIGDTSRGVKVTNRDKAILWQLQNKSWKPKSNPYDKEVGKMVYDLLWQESATEEQVTGQETDVMSLLT